MQRKTAVYRLAASMILALAVPAAHIVTAHTRFAPAAGHADRVTACASSTGVDGPRRRTRPQPTCCARRCAASCARAMLTHISSSSSWWKARTRRGLRRSSYRQRTRSPIVVVWIGLDGSCGAVAGRYVG